MDNFEENIIIGIFVSLIAEVIFRTIDCIILNKEGLKDFISRLLKQKSKGILLSVLIILILHSLLMKIITLLDIEHWVRFLTADDFTKK